MAYRNGTYIAFHANNTSEPTESDRKYYELLKAWKVRSEGDFEFVNSHEKTAAVRDSSRHATLEASLKRRLLNSKNMVLIIGKTTREDRDWVPFEIRYAVDDCQIPIIAAYPGVDYVMPTSEFSQGEPCTGLDVLWPPALRVRIDDGRAHVIHVPFKQLPLADAVVQFTHDNLPEDGFTYYSRETYISWGLMPRPSAGPPPPPPIFGSTPDPAPVLPRSSSFLAGLLETLPVTPSPPTPRIPGMLRDLEETYRREYDMVYGVPTTLAESLRREHHVKLRMGSRA